MGQCFLCPPDDNHIPDDDMPNHVRLFHPAQNEALQVWPDGAPLVEDADPDPDDFNEPPGCTGYHREDIDYGTVLLHNVPCPVHPVGCPLACSEGHTYAPGCQLHIPPLEENR